MIERMRKSGPALNDEDIARAERQLKVQFPEQYRTFLKRYNGGRPVPDGFPEGSRARNSTLQVFYRIEERPRNLVEQVKELREIGRISLEYLPIANDDFDNIICLMVTGPDAGKVYFWEHESADDAAFLELAPDLDRFLATFFD